MKKLKLVLNVTNVCNLNCKYCYVDKCSQSVMSYPVAQQAISSVREMNDLFEREVTFFGGEPSLVHNLINKLRDENKDMAFSIISNGYRLFEENDAPFYSRFDQCTITIEGTEKSYNVLRTNHHLDEHVAKLIDLKLANSSLNLVVNISLNGLLLDDVDEFLTNMDRLVNSNIKVHMYMIKGCNYFKSPEDVYTLLNILEEHNIEFLNEFLNIRHYHETDTPFLCTYDNSIMCLSNGDLVPCSWDGRVTGNVYDKTTYANILGLYRENHRSLWQGCANCDVPVGMCQVSCPAWIRECVNNRNFEDLNHVCDCERVIEFKRRELLRKSGD